MNKIKNSFYGAKTHFKMYKKGRQWLVAGVTVMSLGLGVLGLNTVTASAATTETPVAATAPATEKTTTDASTTNTNAEQSATDTASAEAPDTVDTATANAGAEQPDTDTANVAVPEANTTTPVTTNLGDATAQEVEADKAKATADYQQTGQAQTLTAVAAESNQNVTVNFSSTIQTDKGQVLSSKNFNNEFNFTVGENNLTQSVNSSHYGSLTDTIPNGYKLKEINLIGKNNSGDVSEINYDAITGHGTTNVTTNETPAEIDQELQTILTNGVVKFNDNQFTIEYDDFDSAKYSSATTKLGSLINDIYTNYDFTFIVTDTAITQTVTQPYQTVVKTTDGNVLNSQNAVNTYVVRTSDDGLILSVTSVDNKDLTDTIPDGYRLNGIQIVDTTNVNQTVMTVTYDLSTDVGNIVITSVDPATGQTVTTDYSKSNSATASELALQTIKQLISPEPTANGTHYNTSFKNIVNENTLLNVNVNQHSTNTVITYIVEGQPSGTTNQGGSTSGNPSGNNGPQGSINDATNTGNTDTTDSNNGAASNSNIDATNANTEAVAEPNTETTTAPGSAISDENGSDTQNNSLDNNTDTPTNNNRVSTLNNTTNGGTAVAAATTTGTKQSLKANNQAETSTLPQTNEDSVGQASALLGMGILASLAGLFGISRRKKEQ